MGNLTPGANYIYESPDNGKTVYAREVGSNKKTLIGYHLPNNNCPLNTMQEYSELDFKDEIWADMHRLAKDHDALKKSLEQCKIIYHMIKESESNTIFHHPV
jgi:hypothetical protein